MSEMKPDIDLAALARARPEPAVGKPKRRWFVLALPLVLVLGFVAVLLSTLGDLFRGTVPVTVVRPAADEARTSTSGETALQRSGWVEPDPFPVFVPALAAGVVREVLVLESDAVTKDQPLARLVDDQARLVLAQAEASLLRAEAAAARARVARDLAQERFDAALEVTEAKALAAADVRARAAEAEQRAAAVRDAQASVRVAEEELDVQRYLTGEGAAGPRQIELSEAKASGARSAVSSLEAAALLGLAEQEKAEARSTRATREGELRLDDRSRLELARTDLALAEGAVGEARAARDLAALELERTTVRAPAAGVVMQRFAAVGTAVGGPADPPLLALYDPSALRVRVDVEQSQVGRLAVGQAARIRSPMRPERDYDGEVSRIVHVADVQKVTLQVHVKVREPDAGLRPEVLVEVHFLARATGPEGAAAGAPRAAVWIPRRVLVEGGAERGVWIVDALTGRAALRKVEVEREEGERALVRSGLDPSDKVIDRGREGLRAGARLRIEAEGP